MAYIYQVTFAISPEQMGELEIGASVERVANYLRIFLPDELGYITSRAMYSLDVPGKTCLVFESMWDQWEDLEAHRKTGLAENRVLTEFQPHVSLQDLDVHVYEEVA